MIHKINRRTKTYRRLAIAIGYRLRVIALPDSNFGLSGMPSGAPDDSLIGAVSPEHMEECAFCDRLACELCQNCGGCVSGCCECRSDFSPIPTDLDPQTMAMEAAS